MAFTFNGTLLATKISQIHQSGIREFLQVNNEPQFLQTTQTTQTPLDRWLVKLSKNENCPIEGIIDSNGLRSYGKFCYQLDTFKRYIRKHNLLPYTPDDELLNMISDEDLQWRLTKMMILDDYNNWKHWRNVVEKKIGLPPK